MTDEELGADLGAGLRAAVAEEPPLAFDPRRLIEQAQRSRRRRRALAGVCAAVAVIGIGAIAVPLAGGGHPTVSAAAGGAPTLRTSPPARPTSTTDAHGDIPWPPAGVTPPHYTQQQLLARAAGFTNRLKADLPNAVPGAAVLSVQPWGGEATGSVSDGQNYLDTFFRVQLPKHQAATLFAQVEAPGMDNTTPARMCSDDQATTCVRTVKAGGELVVETDDLAPGVQTLTVRDYHADGSVTFATAYTYDPVNKAGPGGPNGPLPVTADQLTVLVTDPALVL
jgi:hypothetical protein